MKQILKSGDEYDVVFKWPLAMWDNANGRRMKRRVKRQLRRRRRQEGKHEQNQTPLTD